MSLDETHMGFLPGCEREIGRTGLPMFLHQSINREAPNEPQESHRVGLVRIRLFRLIRECKEEQSVQKALRPKCIASQTIGPQVLARHGPRHSHIEHANGLPHPDLLHRLAD
ncbi:MAG: hypothetical protein U1F61_26370 [Opitutaceae bacterium]